MWLHLGPVYLGNIWQKQTIPLFAIAMANRIFMAEQL